MVAGSADECQRLAQRNEDLEGQLRSAKVPQMLLTSGYGWPSQSRQDCGTILKVDGCKTCEIGHLHLGHMSVTQMCFAFLWFCFLCGTFCNLRPETLPEGQPAHPPPRLGELHES